MEGNFVTFSKFRKMEREMKSMDDSEVKEKNGRI